MVMETRDFMDTYFSRIVCIVKIARGPKGEGGDLAANEAGTPEEPHAKARGLEEGDGEYYSPESLRGFA